MDTTPKLKPLNLKPFNPRPILRKPTLSRSVASLDLTDDSPTKLEPAAVKKEALISHAPWPGAVFGVSNSAKNKGRPYWAIRNIPPAQGFVKFVWADGMDYTGKNPNLDIKIEGGKIVWERSKSAAMDSKTNESKGTAQLNVQQDILLQTVIKNHEVLLESLDRIGHSLNDLAEETNRLKRKLDDFIDNECDDEDEDENDEDEWGNDEEPPKKKMRS